MMNTNLFFLGIILSIANGLTNGYGKNSSIAEFKFEPTPTYCDQSECIEGEDCDWFAKKSVDPWVFDQESNPYCAAIVTTDLLTSRLAIETGKLISLSAQQSLDCLHGKTRPTQRKVVEYLMKMQEDPAFLLAYEKDYGNGHLSYHVHKCEKPRVAPKYRVTETELPVRMTSLELINQVSLGPVSGNVCASTRFNSAKCEVYYPDERDFRCTGMKHSVLIYGYELNQIHSNMTGVNFMIKNSLGFEWGCLGKVKFFVGDDTQQRQILLSHPSWAQVEKLTNNEDEIDLYAMIFLMLVYNFFKVIYCI